MVRFWARRRRDESGVVAILVALLSVLLLMFAAYAVDIGMQINRKHQLNDTLDAAAQAGAYELPGSATNAKVQALKFAEAHDPTEKGTLAPNVDFWCVVASKLTSGVYQPDATQIPSTCYPGTTPYTAGLTYKSTNKKVACSKVLCAIPCVQPTPNTGTPPIKCNTIRVSQGRVVPFGFAPAGGIQQGGTGNLISVACKGSCGTVAPNPMDVAIVADRTQSMGTSDINNMVAGIRSMLQVMTPDQQYVALGTIGRSGASSTSQSGSCRSGQLTYPSDSGSSGKWLPVSFSKDYVNGSGVLQDTALVKGVDCLTKQSNVDQGTSLAAPMRAAARYLLGIDPNNLPSPDPRPTPPTKVLIFETDGQPNEHEPTGGSTALGGLGDPFSHTMRIDPIGVPSAGADTQTTSTSQSTTTVTVTHHRTVTHTYNGGANACQNLIDVAANAKARGILVIMIGYNMSSKRCFDYDGMDDNYNNKTNYVAGDNTANGPEPDKSVKTCDSKGRNCTTTITKYRTQTITKWVKASASTPVLNVLAQAASANAGLPAAAQSDCSDALERSAENADGDYLFCGATGTDMAPIFKTALGQVSKGIKLIRMPQ